MAIGTPTDPIDFPNAPVHGQVHAENGKMYVFILPDNVWVGGKQAQDYLLKLGNVFFSHFFLGMLDFDPKVGLEGFKLIGGEVYYNRIEKQVKVYDPTNGWQPFVSPTKAVVSNYIYLADGIRTAFSGLDTEKKALSFDVTKTQPVQIYVSGVRLVETTATNVGAFTVDRVSSTITFTKAPRRGAKVLIDVLMEDKSTSSGGALHTIGSTTFIKGSVGATLNDKLAGAIKPVISEVGTTLVVPYIAGGADNSYAGIWIYNGVKYSHDLDLSSIAGTNMYQTAAATIGKQATTVLKSTLDILKTRFHAIFTHKAAKGDFVTVGSGVGADNKYAGLYYYTGVEWIASAAPWNPNYATTFLKPLVGDLDPDIAKLGIGEGSILFTLENEKKEIKVVDSTGNWTPFLSETKIKEWIAAGSLFQGSVKEATLATDLPGVALKNKGYYWTWVGAATAHIDISTNPPVVVLPTDTVAYAAADVFNPGDWLQSSGTKWVHVPGDLLSKQRWDSLGSLSLWTNGKYEKDSIVRWKPSTTEGIHYYKAKQDITASDIAPGLIASPGLTQNWEDITPVVKPEELGNVKYLGTAIAPVKHDLMEYDGTSWVIREHMSDIREWDPAQDYNKDNAVVWTHTPATPGMAPRTQLYVSLDSVGNVGQDPETVDRYWRPLVRQTLTDLGDVTILTPRSKDVLVYDSASSTFKNMVAGEAFKWEDTEYNIGDVVTDMGEWYRALKSIAVGTTSPSADTQIILHNTVTIGSYVAFQDRTSFSTLSGSGLAQGEYALIDGTGLTLPPGPADHKIVGGPFDGVTVKNYNTADMWAVLNTGDLAVGVGGYVLFPVAAASGTGTGSLVTETVSSLEAYSDLNIPSSHSWKKLGINVIGDLEDVTLSRLATDEILVQKGGQWVNKTFIQMFAWTAKPYPQDTMVVHAGIWYQSVIPLNASIHSPDLDDGTNWKLMGNHSIKKIEDIDLTGLQDRWVLQYDNTTRTWKAVVNHAEVPNWDPTVEYFPNQMVIRVPTGGADTYAGEPKAFIAQLLTQTDPLTTPSEWHAIGGIPDGVDDDDRLSWDTALNSWVTATNELGYETNIVSREDGGSFVYDEDNNTFDIRKLTTYDLGDVSNQVPAVNDVLLWNGTEYIPYDLAIGDMLDVDMAGIVDGQLLLWDATSGSFLPADAAKKRGAIPREIFTWDATAGYIEGNLVEFNKKVYKAVTKPSAYVPPVDGVNIAITSVDASTIPFNNWIVLPPQIGDSYHNDTASTLIHTGHGLHAQVQQPNEGLIFLGLNESINLTLGSSKEKIVGGLLLDTVGVAAVSFNQLDIDEMTAADAAANLVTPGADPTVAPTNWELIGEPNKALPVANDGDILEYSVLYKDWVAKKSDFLTAASAYTKPEADKLFVLEAIAEAAFNLLNQKVDSIFTGTAHGIEIQDIMDTPPTVALEGEVWIVGPNPTDDFIGHAGELAWSDGVNWNFTPATTNETHYVEHKQGTYNFNGTAWVKIASTTAAIAGTTANGIGEVVAWALPGVLPDGLIELKGQVLAVTSYPDLYRAIGNVFNAGTAADGVTTFAVPDYRGYVLKGEGVNSDGVGDVAFTPGSKQLDQNKAHRHNVDYGTQNPVVANQAGSFNAAGNTWAATIKVGTTTFEPIAPEGGAEVRVKSIATRWCMRYKGVNAGVRGPAGNNYADGNNVGDSLIWNGSSWVSGGVTALGWIHDKLAVGDHAFGVLDSKAFKTSVGAKYKISARYNGYWSHNNNKVDIVIHHGGSEIASSHASAGAYRNSESLCAVVDGTGNIETFSITLTGSGGTLQQYEWIIERIK